jgi:hypothetical protein
VRAPKLPLLTAPRGLRNTPKPRPANSILPLAFQMPTRCLRFSGLVLNFDVNLVESVRKWKNPIVAPPVQAGGGKGVLVSQEAETPFDNIEGSHEYVAMLAEALDEARRDVEAEIAAADRDGAERRKQALLLVSYNLAKLNLHITSSRRILNDLRSLRRLLLAERGLAVDEEESIPAGDGA